MRMLALALVVAVSALSGCATNGNLTTANTPDNAATVDAQKVAALNHAAHQRGVRIIWVHMPKKKIAVAAR